MDQIDSMLTYKNLVDSKVVKYRVVDSKWLNIETNLTF
jgi:hypothetical protein